MTKAIRRPWHRPSLTLQIMTGLVVGGVIGWLRPDWGNAVYFLRDIFLNLIKSIIAPLVFSTLVVGIAGGGDLRKVGRMNAGDGALRRAQTHRRVRYADWLFL